MRHLPSGVHDFFLIRKKGAQSNILFTESCDWQILFTYDTVVVFVIVGRLAPGYFTLNDDKAPPAARDSSEVARSQKQHRYPHTGNGRLTIAI